MTPSEAQEVFALLVAAFPGRLKPEDAKETGKVYRAALGHLERDVARMATMRVIALWGDQFGIPTVAAILRAVSELQRGRRRAGGEAWGDARQAIQRYGARRPPGDGWQFGDPLVTRTVRALGWSHLCRSTDHAADRARFIETYDHLAEGAAEEDVAGAVALPPAPSGVRLIGQVVQNLLTEGNREEEG